MANEFIARNGIVALNNSTITGSLDIAGNLTTTGTITAQKLVVQQVTSSVVFSSGSNVFGNSISNTQSMTGSVGITGSLSINGVAVIANSVSSFNTRSGSVTLSSGDVTTALGFTPYNATNPSSYITTAGARTAVSFTAGSGAYNNTTGVFTIPTNTNQLTNGAGYTTNTGTVTSVSGTGTVSGLTLSGTVNTTGNLTLGGTLSLTSGNVTTALGYTPYNATNPNGYITSAGSISGNAATATAAQNATFLTQANATWGARIQLGGNGSGSGVANIAVVQATDGNIHLDNGVGKSMYLNFYHNGIIYLNGSTYTISANGSQYNGNAATSTFSTSTSRLYSTDASYNYNSGAPYYGYLTYDGTRWLFQVSPGTPAAVRVAYSDLSNNSSNLGGYSASVASAANTIVQRDSNGYISNSYFYSSSGGAERNGSGLSYVAGFNSSDYYIRSYTMQALASALSGASMNIAGNAATATTTTNSSQLGSIAADRFVFGDGANGRSKDRTSQSANTSDSSNSSGFYFGNSTTGMPSADWWNWLTVAGNSWAGSDGYRWQMAGSFWSNDWRLRRQTSGGWNGWVSILHSDNYTSYSPSLTGTGASGTWGISITGNAATATGQQSGAHFSLNTGGAGYGLVGIYNPDVHQGLFAMGSAYTLGAGGTLANFYGVSWSYDYSGRQLNTGYNLQHCLAIANNGVVATVIGLGIWTSGLIRASGSITGGGSLTMAGDVTAFSDARVKENIITVDNALEKTLQLRGVYYNRVDTEDKKRKIGVIAQETLLTIPEVVNQDNEGMYNVAYGNMGGLFIEAIKELAADNKDLRQQIEELKNYILKQN